MTTSELIDTFCNEKGIGEISRWEEAEELMVRFAKYHVEKALQLAGEGFHYTHRKDILNSYPLEKIK